LGYLKRFPVSSIKIDQSFIRDIIVDADDASITSAIIAMGHILNLKVVAEGVETREQLDSCKQQGCDEVQGFCSIAADAAQEVVTRRSPRMDRSCKATGAPISFPRRLCK
jgi:EAL domain-containing protein (putative c-di-GMP-specific phosphodiesterase class I)